MTNRRVDRESSNRKARHLLHAGPGAGQRATGALQGSWRRHGGRAPEHATEPAVSRVHAARVQAAAPKLPPAAPHREPLLHAGLHGVLVLLRQQLLLLLEQDLLLLSLRRRVLLRRAEQAARGRRGGGEAPDCASVA